MFESLKIIGFRGLKDLDVGSLSNVNLIVGPGNTGKTTILESLFVGCGIGAPILLANAIRQRGVDIEDRPYDENIELFRWYFPGGDFTARCGFELVYNGDRRTTLFRRLPEDENIVKILSTTETDETSLPHSKPPEQAIHATVEQVTSIGDKDYTGYLHLRTSSLLAQNSGVESSPSGRFHKVAAHRGAGYRLASLWTKSEEAGDADQIIELMQAIDQDIEAIRIRADSTGRAVLRVEHRRFGRMPLEAMGDGFAKALSIATHIASMDKGSCLFFDEFEVSLHVGVLRKLVRFTLEAARRHNVQIFATTHSLETVDAFVDLAATSGDLWGGPKDFRLINLHGSAPNTKIKNIDGSEAKELREELALDLRRTA